MIPVSTESKKVMARIVRNADRLVVCEDRERILALCALISWDCKELVATLSTPSAKNNVIANHIKK